MCIQSIKSPKLFWVGMSVYLYMVLWWCLQWTNDLISRAGLQLLSTEELYEMMPFSVIAYTTMCDTVYKFMTNQFMQIQHKEGSRTTTWPLSRFTWFDVFFWLLLLLFVIRIDEPCGFFLDFSANGSISTQTHTLFSCWVCRHKAHWMHATATANIPTKYWFSGSERPNEWLSHLLQFMVKIAYNAMVSQAHNVHNISNNRQRLLNVCLWHVTKRRERMSNLFNSHGSKNSFVCSFRCAI